ncbi:MAG: carboxypeptidase-like regulatory domain-containing protein [Vicinamibacterales bacterium]
MIRRLAMLLALVGTMSPRPAPAALPRQAQTPDTPEARPHDGQRDPRSPAAAATAGTARITGQVTDAGGVPLPGTRIVLSRQDDSTLRVADADGSGRFAFDGLAPGLYTATAKRPGFTDAAFGAVRPGATGVVIRLDDGQQLDAPLVMTRVSSIAGTILDERGQPTPAVVAVARWEDRNEPIASDPFRATTTQANRQGRYRIEDLAPGDYVVRAARMGGAEDLAVPDAETLAAARQAIADPNAPLPEITPATSRSLTYVPMFFGDTPAIERATRVHVDPGATRTGVDVRLQAVPTTTLEGRLVMASGGPVANGRVVLLADGERTASRYGATTADGRYRFVGVPAGAYRLITSTRAEPRIPGRAEPAPPMLAIAEVYVDPDNPVADFSPALNEVAGVTLHARLVFDGDRAAPDPRRLLLFLSPVDGPFLGYIQGLGSLVLAFDADGRLTRTGVPPGSYTLGANRIPEGWRLRSAMAGDVDVADVPLDVEPGRPLSEVVVTWTDRDSPIEGTIVDATGRPAFSYTVVVFPADRRAWRPRARRVKAVRPDTQGRFSIATLPQGEYLLALAASFDPSDPISEDLLAQLEPGAVRVTLVEGRTTVQDVRIGGGGQPPGPTGR